ncbi:MAG: hypothetical protein ACYDAN_02525 [Candidatus Limnocylindrales bacterium]
MRAVVAAAVVIAAMVTACGGAPALTPTPAVVTPTPSAAVPSAVSTAAATATPSPALSPSPTPAPTPAVLTIKQAAAAYLRIVNPYNKATAAAWKEYGKVDTLKAQRAYMAALAKAEKTFIDGLKAVAWPPEVKADVTALEKACVVLYHRATVASKDTTFAAFDADARSAYSASNTAADKAAIVRDDLGLPTN